MRIIGILLLLFFSSHLMGSEFGSDMSKVRESYEKYYISMNISYKMYLRSNDVKTYDVQSLWLESFGNMLHYKGQGQEILYTETNMLMIDEDELEIILDTVTNFYNKPNYDLLPIDTTESKMESIALLKLEGGIKRYTLIPKDKTETIKIVLDINPDNWMVKQIEIFGSSDYGGGKVIIQYSNIQKKSNAPLENFKLSRFLKSKSGGGYTSVEKYKSYKFYHKSNHNFKTK